MEAVVGRRRCLQSQVKDLSVRQSLTALGERQSRKNYRI